MQLKGMGFSGIYGGGGLSFSFFFDASEFWYPEVVVVTALLRSQDDGSQC